MQQAITTKRRHNESKTKRPHRKKQSHARGRKGRQVSRLDPELLIKKASLTNEQPYLSDRMIEDLPIHPALKQRLLKKGFERPTEIQDRSLETLVSGRDLLGIASTGTGKTAAFLVPIIQQLLQQKRKPFALVIVPTRELALQIDLEFRSITKGLGLYSACFIGGTNINKDIQTLKRASHLVIATPGRLLDLVDRRMIDLTKFNTLVLDEFDRMLDMGFIKDVERIINSMPHRKQTMLFSATYDKKQSHLINTILHNPETVKVSEGDSSGDHIEQDIIKVRDGENKFQILLKMMSEDEFEKVLVFEETKHRASRLCKKLNRAGIRSEDIHSNKSQNARQRALKAFKQGRITVLVATDVAARGIDVLDITHVINYQLPMTLDSYIHRIGRTGRAGKHGQAITFVD